MGNFLYEFWQEIKELSYTLVISARSIDVAIVFTPFKWALMVLRNTDKPFERSLWLGPVWAIIVLRMKK